MSCNRSWMSPRRNGIWDIPPGFSKNLSWQTTCHWLQGIPPRLFFCLQQLLRDRRETGSAPGPGKPVPTFGGKSLSTISHYVTSAIKAIFLKTISHKEGIHDLLEIGIHHEQATPGIVTDGHQVHPGQQSPAPTIFKRRLWNTGMLDSSLGNDNGQRGPLRNRASHFGFLL